MSKKNLSGLLAIPLVTIMLITGCTAPGPNVTEPPTPSPSISEPATPAPTQAPEPELTVGEPVDAATAAELNEAKGDERAYPMPDGTYLLVSKNAPLPEAVQNDVNAKGTAYTTEYPSIDPTQGTARIERDRAAVMGEVGKATGKRVIFGMKMSGYINADDANMTTYYFFNGAFQSPEPRYYSKADAEAAVNAWLSQQENPNLYVVVWGD